MRVSAKTDYGLRALVALAAGAPYLVKLDALVAGEGLPRKFVESILSELRRAGFVHSRRGAEGGYGLAVPAAEISVGAVIRVLDGPLAEGPRTDVASPAAGRSAGGTASGTAGGVDDGPGDRLADLWAAMAVSVGNVLDSTTVEHLVSGQLPEHVRRLAECARGPRPSGSGG